MAAILGHVDTCKKLLQLGAKLDVKDKTGQTALHKTAMKGSVECLDYLISSGADFTIIDK